MSFGSALQCLHALWCDPISGPGLGPDEQETKHFVSHQDKGSYLYPVVGEAWHEWQSLPPHVQPSTVSQSRLTLERTVQERERRVRALVRL